MPLALGLVPVRPCPCVIWMRSHLTGFLLSAFCLQSPHFQIRFHSCVLGTLDFRISLGDMIQCKLLECMMHAHCSFLRAWRLPLYSLPSVSCFRCPNVPFSPGHPDIQGSFSAPTLRRLPMASQPPLPGTKGCAVHLPGQWHHGLLDLLSSLTFQKASQVPSSFPESSAP